VSNAFEALVDARRGDPIALLHGGGVGPTWLCRKPIASLDCGPSEWRGAFDRLGAFLGEHHDHRVVGWLGYDLGLDVESWPQLAPDEFPVPVLHMTAYAEVSRFEGVSAAGAPAVDAARDVRASISQQGYEQRVQKVVDHIKDGDIFQANLTQPFVGKFDGDPRKLFWRLCEQSPAPFAAYIEDGKGTAVLSSSPEEFLLRDGQKLRTRPIKGTRPRSADGQEDARLMRELLASEKDLAELAMIVDLLRNDLGKVAEVGSVEVGQFPQSASFAQVHHLFATVTAKLREGVSTTDLLRATFPGGSITGCPKLRCLEIIEQLEVMRRGVYTGAIGWFGPGDTMHLNIAIRTLVHQRGQVMGNAGGGVTALSDPHLEWRESLAKMAGLERALQTEIQIPLDELRG
jgi:para-aminobenzoate synthetase component I